MRLYAVLACAVASIALGRSDHLLSARRSVALRSSDDGWAPPAETHPEDLNEETHLHEAHPQIWTHEMPVTVEAFWALLWVTMIASVPLIIPMLDSKPITNTQFGLAWLMWAALFGGLYMFTHIIKFNSAHFSEIRCLTLVECIYLMSQVITTVGYGDITPAYPRGQVFVAVYVIASMLVIAMLVSDLAQHIISKADEYEKKLAVKAEQEAVRIRKNSGLSGSVALRHKIAPPSWTQVVRAIILFVVFASIGIIFFHFYPGEGKTWFQAVYMSIITLSTVGFGAFTPSTEAGKVFGAFWMVFGCSALVNVVTSFTELMVNMNEYERYDHSTAMGDFLSYKQKLDVDRVDRLTFLKLALVHKGMGTAEDMDGIHNFFTSLQPDAKDGCLERDFVENKVVNNTHPAMRPVHHLRKRAHGNKFTPRKST